MSRIGLREVREGQGEAGWGRHPSEIHTRESSLARPYTANTHALSTKGSRVTKTDPATLQSGNGWGGGVA